MKSGRSEHKESSPVQANEAENTSGRKKNTLIFACSGLSNTGKLTMLAASTLAFRRPDIYRAASAPKKLDEAGMQADIYMTVTELGIEKTRPSDVKPEYIEIIIRRIRET